MRAKVLNVPPPLIDECIGPVCNNWHCAYREMALQIARGVLKVLICDRDDDLALRASGFDIGQRVPGLLKREHLVDDRPDDTQFDQGGNLTQLLPLRAHEQE